MGSNVQNRLLLIYSFFDQYLSRCIQFSRASLNGALTQHKNKDIKTRQLIKLRRQHVPQAMSFYFTHTYHELLVCICILFLLHPILH